PYENCDRYQQEVKSSQLLDEQMNDYFNTAEFIADLQNWSIPHEFHTFVSILQVQHAVQQRLGLSTQLTPDNIYDLYEICRFDRSWSDIHQSPWCAAFSDHDLVVLEYRDDIRHYYRNGYGSWETELCPLEGCTWQQFQDKFQRFTSANLDFCNCEAVSVWTLNRHGNRNPGNSVTESIKYIASLKDEIVASYEAGRSQLWYKELFDIATRIREKYPHLLQGIAENYYFRPADEDITVTSAIAFAHGLNYGTNLTLYIDSDRIRDDVNKVQHAVQGRLGLSTQLTTANIYELYEICRYDRSWSEIHQSPWCAAFSDHDLEINVNLGGIVLKDLYKKFEAAAQGHGRKVTSYFTYETTLEMVWCALGIFKDPNQLQASFRNPGRVWRTSFIGAFATNLIAVLNSCQESGVQTHRVQFFINEKETELCPLEGCTWQQFQDKFQRFTSAKLNFCSMGYRVPELDAKDNGTFATGGIIFCGIHEILFFLDKDVENFRRWTWNKTIEVSPFFLTGTGYEEVFGIAKRIREKYPHLLQGDEKDYYIRSLYDVYIAASAKAFSSKGTEQMEAQWKFLMSLKQLSQHVQNAVQQRLGMSTQLTPANIYTIYEICRHDRSWSKIHRSPWCAAFSNQDLEVLEYWDDNFHATVQGQGRKLTSHFAHLKTLEMVWSAMGIFRDPRPLEATNRNYSRLWRTSKMGAFAQNMIAVLYSVKFFINEKETALCPFEGCTWQQFQDKFQRFTSANLDFCGMDWSVPENILNLNNPPVTVTCLKLCNK
ncbi:putative multiple inositol polyphosphate phosphatase, partial [Operophtera brumata]